MKKIDYKKEMKHLYNAPARNPEIVDVPRMNFLMVNGEGDPNVSERFKGSVEALFGLSYTLKFMIKKSNMQIDYGVSCTNILKRTRKSYPENIMKYI